MATGRDRLFMRKSASFTKQVRFYASRIQTKPKLYPLSCDRNIMHHHYHTAGTTAIAHVHTKLKFFPTSASNKLLNFHFKVQIAEHRSCFKLPVNAKELLLILWARQPKFLQVEKVEIASILFVWQTSLPVILFRAQCACIISRQEVHKMHSLVCISEYVETNIVSYISHPGRCKTCITLLDRTSC